MKIIVRIDLNRKTMVDVALDAVVNVLVVTAKREKKIVILIITFNAFLRRRYSFY